MYRCVRKTLFVLILFLSILILTSCEEHKKNRFYLTERIQYLEAPQHYNLGDIKRRIKDFKLLKKDQRVNFFKVMENKENYIWLKIDFIIPTSLRHKDLAFYVPQLHSAARVYINDKFIKQYGDFPPYENSSGFQSQLYLFPKENLFATEKNTIYIQCWPGIYGALYGDVCIGPQKSLTVAAERANFHYSRITLTFAGILLLVFFMYMFLYYVMKRFETNKEYLYYALTLFYTVHFLFPFFLPEISWIKPDTMKYLTILKVFGGIGAVSTIYFANTFILTYIHYKPTIKNTIPRLILYLISIVGIMATPSYGKFNTYMCIFGSFSLLQFINTVRQLILAFMNKEKRRHAALVLLGFTPVILTVILDFVLRAVFHKMDEPYYTIYGWQFTILVFLIYLLVRFSKMYTHNAALSAQLEHTNAHLEDLVGIRTKELSEANYNLSQGLETVSHVQSNFIPPKSRSFEGWDLSVYYKALDHEVSGDLYDYYYTNGTLDGVGLFDVSGHGISAGLMTILAKGIISQLFKTGVENDEPVSEILKNINKNYIKEKGNIENYITGLLFHFGDFNDNDICSVELANAGHPYPLYYNSETDKITELKHTDTTKQFGFIGIDGLDVSFPSIYFTTQKNDIIVCFTDGLTESENSNKEQFSKERLMNIIMSNKKATADELVAIIKNELDIFVGSEALDDDISFIVLKRTDTNDFIEEI